MKRSILGILLIVWVVLWIVFTARELFYKGMYRDYAILLTRTLEGKRSYVTGDDLYGFIQFCRRHTPERSTFTFDGLEGASLDMRRTTYYLYPRLESDRPDFVFVYRLPERPRDGYAIVARYEDKGYIQKRDGG